MQTETSKNEVIAKNAKTGLELRLPTSEYRRIPVPGVEGAYMGMCFVRVADLPATLDRFMAVNPRVPSRTVKGLLTGPVSKGILETLREHPSEMVLKNQGIYILTEKAEYDRRPTTGSAKGTLTLQLKDIGRHGIVNGGHTYAAIREAVDAAEGEELEQLRAAYVRLHIYEGISEEHVPEIAEGLNRSRQVDDPSLMNLQGEFDVIRKVMNKVQGSEAVAYHQGDAGEIYISEILVYLAMFDVHRFDERRHPNGLYNRQSLGLKYFADKLENDRTDLKTLIQRLPDILRLGDMIRKATPKAAKNAGFRFGQIRIGDIRAGNPKLRGVYLPFLAETVDYRVPQGWVYPMLSAFRANLKLSQDGKAYEWRAPLDKLLPAVIDKLVAVCVAEHKANGMRPELVGKRESAYAQCFTQVQLYLAKKGLLL